MDATHRLLTFISGFKSCTNVGWHWDHCCIQSSSLPWPPYHFQLRRGLWRGRHELSWKPDWLRPTSISVSFWNVLNGVVTSWNNSKKQNMGLICPVFRMNSTSIRGSTRLLNSSISEWSTVCLQGIISMEKSFNCIHSILANCRRCMLNFLWPPTSACQTWKHCRTSSSQPPTSLFGLMRKKKLKCHGTGATRILTFQPLSSIMSHWWVTWRSVRSSLVQSRTVENLLYYNTIQLQSALKHTWLQCKHNGHGCFSWLYVWKHTSSMLLSTITSSEKCVRPRSGSQSVMKSWIHYTANQISLWMKGNACCVECRNFERNLTTTVILYRDCQRRARMLYL